MFDPDAPIPYELTPKGREALQFAAAEEAVRDCNHDFSAQLGARFVCRHCGFECGPRKSKRGTNYERY